MEQKILSSLKKATDIKKIQGGYSFSIKGLSGSLVFSASFDIYDRTKNPKICSFPKCDLVIDGYPVYYGTIHRPDMLTPYEQEMIDIYVMLDEKHSSHRKVKKDYIFNLLEI
jgi:hypothetical protein